MLLSSLQVKAGWWLGQRMHAAGEAEQLQQILEMVWKKWDDIQWVN